MPREPDYGAAALGLDRLLVGQELAARETTVLTDDHADSDADSPWAAVDGFQLGGARTLSLPVVIDGHDVEATVTYAKDGTHVAIDGVDTGHGCDGICFGQRRLCVARWPPDARARAGFFRGINRDGGRRRHRQGADAWRVLELFAGVGEAVTRGQPLAVIEAMKMEHTLHAPFAGVVQQVAVAPGAQVVEGAEIMVIEPTEAR